LPDAHNWNELKEVLVSLNFKQVITKDERVVYSKEIDGIPVPIVIQKSNRLDLRIIEEYCLQIGITYGDFCSIYRMSYAGRRQ
jgi:hypothetical protein